MNVFDIYIKQRYFCRYNNLGLNDEFQNCVVVFFVKWVQKKIIFLLNEGNPLIKKRLNWTYFFQQDQPLYVFIFFNRAFFFVIW